MFIGRRYEMERLDEIAKNNTPAILAVYGRRRVGKTTLIEHAFSKRNIIKIEGIEDLAKRDQILSATQQLAALAIGLLPNRCQNKVYCE